VTFPLTCLWETFGETLHAAKTTRLLFWPLRAFCRLFLQRSNLLWNPSLTLGRSISIMSAVMSEAMRYQCVDGPKTIYRQRMSLTCEYVDKYQALFCGFDIVTRTYKTFNYIFPLFCSNHIMHFLRSFFVSLVLGIAVVIASFPEDVLVPGAQIRSLPIATSAPIADEFSWKKSAVLHRRYRYGQPAQKPLNGCPEMFSTPVLDCSVCGGEDPNVPRACSQLTSSGAWRCACTFNSVPISRPKSLLRRYLKLTH